MFSPCPHKFSSKINISAFTFSRSTYRQFFENKKLFDIAAYVSPFPSDSPSVFAIILPRSSIYMSGRKYGYWHVSNKKNKENIVSESVYFHTYFFLRVVVLDK